MANSHDSRFRPLRHASLALNVADGGVAAPAVRLVRKQRGRMTDDFHHPEPQSQHRDPSARAADAKRHSPFLSTAQAAHYVNLSRRTLEKMRCNGAGPEYRKHGRYVRYHIDALDAWSVAHAKHSTAEA